MAKKNKKLKADFVGIVAIIIIICIISLTIGFSSFQDNLTISSAVAVIRANKVVRITGFSYDSATNGGTVLDNHYTENGINGTITLPYSNSSVMFEVEVTNIGNVEVGFSEFSDLNPNLAYEITRYTEGTKLCNSQMQCSLNAKVTFNITIKYAEGATVTNNQISFSGNFIFKEAYDITYINTAGTNNFPNVILDGETLTVTFATDVPYDLKITKSDSSVLSSNSYTYVTSQNNSNYKVLTIPNVNSSLIIDRYYPITYILNGGTNNSNNPTKYLTSDNITFNNPTHSNNNYAFGGWYQNSSFTGTPVTSTSDLNGNATLYAKWTNGTILYTITYNLNNGTQANNQVTSYYTSTPQNILSPTRSNYTFAGWYQTSDYTDTVVTSTTDLNGNATLYAKWTATITYDTIGAGTIQQTTYVYGQPQNIATTTRSNYTFAGWYQDSNYTGSAITSTGDLDNNSVGNALLYAKWTAIINYNAGFGTEPSLTTYVYNKPQNIPDSTNKYGAQFGGWYETDDFSGSIITSTGDLNGNAALYARWTDTVSNAYYDDSDHAFHHDFNSTSLGSYNNFHNNATYTEPSAQYVVSTISVHLTLSYDKKAGNLPVNITSEGNTVGTGSMTIAQNATSADVTITLNTPVQVGNSFTLSFGSFSGNQNKLSVSNVTFIINP